MGRRFLSFGGTTATRPPVNEKQELDLGEKRSEEIKIDEIFAVTGTTARITRDASHTCVHAKPVFTRGGEQQIHKARRERC